MWAKVARLILRNRISLLIIIGVITIFMGYQTTLVQMDYNYATMLSADDPVYLDNLRFKQVFGDEANGIVVGIVNKDFFVLNDFTKLQNLSNEIKKIKNVSGVLSVNSAVNIKQVTVKDENGANKRIFETYNIFPDKIENQLELDSLKDVFLSLPFYKGLLYNQSTHVYLLVVSINKEILNSPQRIPTVKEIEKVVRNYAEVNNIEIHISGQPYIRTQMMGLVQREVKLFIFLAIAICIIILYLFFRSFKVIGVALIVIGVSVLWTIGLMGLCHYKITILSGMIPPLLIVIGIPNTIFLSNKFHSEAKSHGNKILALQRVISKIGNAVFLSNATTAAGFATFIITNSNLLVEFGVIASIGVMITFAVALIIIPSIFSFLQPPSEKYTKHLTNKHITKIIDTIINIVHNHRRKVYFTVIAVLIAAGFGVTLIERTGFLLDDIPKSDPIYVDLKFLEKNFNGVFPIEILIESRDSLQGSELIYQIQKIDSLQQRLTKYPELSRSMSVADAVKFLYQSYSKGNQENYMLPADPKTYETIFKRLPNGLDQKLAKSFIDSTNTITRISLNIADIGTNRMEVLIPKIKKDIHDLFPDKNYKSLITGSTVLYFTGTTYLINNLFGSLILAIIIIGLLMFGLQRSPKIVGIALVPNLIPMIVTAALMGYFGIPIKPSTILVFGIALGISVDGTIHFLTKYRQEMLANDMNISYSVQRALRETGPSLMYTGVILFFGFMIFTFSGFGGTVALGFLISMTLLVAMIGNLLLLPTLLISLEKYIKKKELLNPIFEMSDETDDCDQDIDQDCDKNEKETL